MNLPKQIHTKRIPLLSLTQINGESLKIKGAKCVIKHNPFFTPPFRFLRIKQEKNDNSLSQYFSLKFNSNLPL